MQTPMQLIGSIAVPEITKTTRYYECAAWYTHLDLDPGVFDLHLSFTFETWPQFVSWTQPGIVTGDCFDSLFCGNLIAPLRDRDVGKRQEYTHSTQAGFLPTLAGGKVTLFPEWEWLLLPCEQWRPYWHLLRLATGLRACRVEFDSVQYSLDGLLVVKAGEKIVTFTVGDDGYLTRKTNLFSCRLFHLGEPFWNWSLYSLFK